MTAAILLTPGPLTTTARTKEAMLRDWGSWDQAFNRLTAEVCEHLLGIVAGQASHVCVPMQGSGTFAVEAAVGTLLPRNGKLLILVNGAYGKRIAHICRALGRNYCELETPEDAPAVAADVARLLEQDPAISHVAVIHCETSTGVLNPLADIARIVEQHGRKLIIDAMSTFAAIPIDATEIPFDGLIAASGKCLEGVPGMGFVIVRQSSLLAAEGNSQSLALDLLEQYRYLQRTGQWRFTPPTHVIAALHEALCQYREEGGQAARNARYRDNAQALIDGMRALGLRPFLREENQAPIIVTFHAPRDRAYDFKTFYEKVRDKGFILYPGKLTRLETFRVGCIGDVCPDDMRRAVQAIGSTLWEMGVSTV